MLKASLFLLFCGLLLSLAEYSQAESNTPICESYSSSNFNGLNFEIKSYTANLKLVKLKNSSEIYVALTNPTALSIIASHLSRNTAGSHA